MTDLHIHTAYCDGKNTPREMVEAAIKRGIKTLGFSEHSLSQYGDEFFGLTSKAAEAYRAEIAALKEEYRDRVVILCGIEQDYFSPPAEGYDYVIGSVHCLKKDGEYLMVDYSPEIMRRDIDTHFGADAYAYAESYFELVADVLEKTGADIVGHFDLLLKFNRDGEFFDTAHPRYRAAWQAAADRLLTYGKPFEINTGAISRGYTDLPYPDRKVIDYIKAHGGKLLLSSDSHRADTIGFQFEKFATWL